MRLAVIIVAVLVSSAHSAVAAPETHDGFAIRLGLGPSGTSASASVDGEDDSLEVEGNGPVIDIAIGGAVAENLILHGNITGFLSSEPDVKFNGTVGQLEDHDFDVTTVGIGVTYYFMPVNLYLSGSLVSVQITLRDEDGDEVGETDGGFGMQLAIGKEWWVSDDWGIGLAAVGMGGSIEGKNRADQDVNWSIGTFGLYFSATYN